MVKVFVSFFLFATLLYGDRDAGPYIGIGYGSSTFFDDGLYESIQNDTSGSTTIYGGAYINKHLSVELSYVSFDSKNKDDGYVIDNNTSLGFGVITVSTLAHYPFYHDKIDTYLKFGVGEISLSGIEKSGFSLLFGAGVGFRFNDVVSLKLAYDYYQFSYDNDINPDEEIAEYEQYNMNISFIYSALEIQF